MDFILKLQQNMDKRNFPEDRNKAIITSIFKKEDKLHCGNNRWIVLLSFLLIFMFILQRRVIKTTKEILPESQASFRSGRATVDQLPTLRQIEKYLEVSKICTAASPT